MTRTNFNEWTKIFDMSQFEMEAIDVNMDRRKYDLLNSWQLKTEIDTFNAKQLRNKQTDFFRFNNIFETPNKDEKEKEVEKKAKLTKVGKGSVASQNEIKKKKESLDKKIKEAVKPDQFKTPSAKFAKLPPFNKDSTSSLVEYYTQSAENKRFISSANVSAVRDKDHFFNKNREYNNLRKQKNVYILRRHQQFSWAIICVLFLFIGAPMESNKFKELISKYWEGTSSLEEEFQLKTYLLTEEGKLKHPEESAMFGFFNHQRDIESSITEFPVEKLEPPKARKLFSLSSVRNIAAALLIILGGYFVWNQISIPPEKNQLATNTTWREVEDPKEALKITKEALAFLSNKVDKSERLIKSNVAKLSVNKILKK